MIPKLRSARATIGTWARPPTHSSAAGEIEPLIIVGIYNTGKHRIDEYTPVEDKRLGGGQADAYGQMLAEELKPFVDHAYRTLPGEANCGLGGSSLGGLVTLYLGLRYTWMFSKLAVMSPSVWWRNRAILKTVAKIKRKPNLKIWLDIGTNEGQRALPDARELNITLVKKGWVEGRDLAYLEVPDAQHTESAWATRVAPMLKFLVPREVAELFTTETHRSRRTDNGIDSAVLPRLRQTGHLRWQAGKTPGREISTA